MTFSYDPGADQDTIIMDPTGGKVAAAGGGSSAAVAAGAGRPVLRARPDRFWFVVVFVLALVVFSATEPGRMVFDTKLGVDVRAGDFLTRLWSLWNPLEWFGSLNDQYIGYAIPMAPFFLAGQLLHVPIWLIERIWLSLLIAVGFIGMVKLGRALRIGSDGTRLVAGAMFALWPTFTIALGSTSAAALPGLLAPWAVLPLVPAMRARTRPGQAAARSGIAVALMGGVNAASTLAVLLLPALYIATRYRGRQRITLGGAWCASVLAATAWWVIPLLLQGRYSFNFLPYIEQSAATAKTMSAATLLRGTGNWTAYLHLNGQPWVTAGWALVTSAAAILATTALAATGLAGLARRDMPERRWLCWCVGLVAVAALAGYYGPDGSPFGTQADALLDGVLAPLRSVYKLEPVIAVALALGAAHLLQRYSRLRVRIDRGRTATVGAVAAPILALALAGLALPQLTGQALQAGSFSSVPRYWSQAAAYLATHSPRNTALVVPADPHGQFTWGDTIDDPLEPLASSPWAERALVPFGGPGSQVLLDTAEQAVESGEPVPGLAGYLARAGIRYVVVRNDTSPDISTYTQPQVVNESLALSGFRRVAAFGPQVAAAPGYPSLAGQDPGFAPSYPAVEMFVADDQALRPSSPVEALPVSQSMLVNGGPDSLLQLTGQGLLRSGQPATIAGQPAAGQPAVWSVTDGQRRTDTAFGTTQNFESYPYTTTGTNPPDDQLGAAGGQPRQLLPVPAPGHQTVAVLSGAASVTASSAGTWYSESPQYGPANAFDGDPSTAWTEGIAASPVGQWLQIDFGYGRDLPATAGIDLLDDISSRELASQLRVTTAAGTAVTDTAGTGAEQRLRLPAGRSGWLRITITGATRVHPGEPGAGITEVRIPGVQVTTYLRPAESPAGGSAPVADYSFSQPAPAPQALPVGARAENINRVFVTPAAARLAGALTVVPTPGPALQSLIASFGHVRRSHFTVTASSSWNNLPAFGPANLFSRGGHLPWLASRSDPAPSVSLSWRRDRKIFRLMLYPVSHLAATPTAVTITSPNGTRRAAVGPGGQVRIRPPLRTNRIRITFSTGSGAATRPGQFPVGLARLTIPALTGLHAAVPAASTAFRLGCGQSPGVSIDGHVYPTSMTGTIGDLIQLLPLRARLCGKAGVANLAAGQHWLTAAPSAAFAVSGVSLTSVPPAGSSAVAGPPATPRPTRLVSWQSDHRSVRIAPGSPSYLEIHENFDPGWHATLGGRHLRAVTLDGWQQAFVVPAGQGGLITLTFTPAGVYHAGLVTSGVLLLIVIGLAAGITPWRRRRLATPAGSPAHELAPRPAVAARRTPRQVATYAAALVPLALLIFVAGGLTVLAVPALALLASRRPRWLPAFAAGAMAAAGIVAATASTPTAIGSGPFSAGAQVCALVALTAALLPASGPAGRPAEPAVTEQTAAGQTAAGQTAAGQTAAGQAQS